ncbi:SEA (Seh1-associated) complex subunit [Neocucurbitaria cava]|uniref:SEA (Seh1-associated) complex subunit n=1 Tax=Neocucurbitaria cava TaxID=798079 RepID=A0A9W8XZN8_9PLEO|nr:SEA (Seh1-associated) complex subunit [Neocucurbitaria cava]
MADRRTSAVAAPPPSSIPPAPPLPKQKSRSYFERFVAQPLTTAYGAGSRPPSVQTSRAGAPNVLVPKLPGIRTGYSHDASHKTGLDISALDVNRERTHAVLAGKEILKTVRVQDAKIVDETNLRAAVLNYADSHARQREGLGIHDVKWSHGQFSSHIATAAANGKVILYDLNRASVELTRLHEHSRQVHKLAFNPHQGHLLLSASHDATVRLWDLRDMRRDITTCRSRDQYAGVNGGIRDVQWSPTDAVEFAFGTDNGTIQRWDFRHNKGPKQKITAHDQRICTSIDWHPDGKHLLSAGVDRTVRVWDFSVVSRRQKPAWILTTPYPVYKARWRPPYWSDESHDKGAYQCTQLATSYDREHPVIHVWDFRRPFLPFREINKFATAPSDMLWHSRDTLWTVGREGVFQQNDVHHAPKTVDRRNLQALAVSPSGEVGGVAQRRPRRRPSASLAYPEDTYASDTHARRSSPEKSSLRSSADDSLDDSFLTSSMKRHHGRTASNRSAKSFSSTPPSDTAPIVMFLSDSMTTHSDSFKPNQLAFRGALPGAPSIQIFSYLAQKYKAIPLSDPPDLDSFLELNRVFEQNAGYAQRAALYRLAQTWRVVGASIASATRRRAELHRERRMVRPSSTMLKSANVENENTSERPEARDKRWSGPPNPAVRAILGTVDKPSSNLCVGQNPTTMESTSNLPTPLARPVNTSQLAVNDTQRVDLPDIDREEIAQLPPSVTGPQTDFGSSFGENKALAPPQATFNGPHWYHSADGLDERRALVGSWRASPRIPLSLEPKNAQGLSITVPPPLERHDSGESFAMFSASTDSQHGNSMPSSFVSGKSQSRDTTSFSENWKESTETSSFGNPRITSHNDQQNDLGRSVPLSPTTISLETGTLRTDVPSNGQRTHSALTGSEASHLVEFSSGERAVQEMQHLRRNNQLLRHDSSESEAYASSRDGTSTPSPEHNIDMEASGTIVPDIFDDVTSPHVWRPPASLPPTDESVLPKLDSAANKALTLADFQALQMNVEEETAYSVVGLLNSLLAYHSSASDAQFSSLLLLLLAPLLPQTHSPLEGTGVDVDEVLTAFTDTFISLGLTQAQAQAILSTQLSQLIATGINPYQAESILHTYHAQLHSLSLFNSAASLRRLAYPTYPAVYEQALKDTQLGLLCLSCKSPINNPKDKMRCESCKRAQAPCPICWSKYPAFEPVAAKKKVKAKLRSSFQDRGHRRKRSSIISNQAIEPDDIENTASPAVPADWMPSAATLWTWCSLCGHGGHASCLSTWFTDSALSEGACPTEGCLCDCVQGKRRDAKLEGILRKKAEKDRSKLVRKGDDWKVDESKAVSAVRGALDAGSTQGATNRKDDKRVRVLAPETNSNPQASGSQFGPSQGSTFGKMPKH